MFLVFPWFSSCSPTRLSPRPEGPIELVNHINDVFYDVSICEIVNCWFKLSCCVGLGTYFPHAANVDSRRDSQFG